MYLPLRVLRGGGHKILGGRRHGQPIRLSAITTFRSLRVGQITQEASISEPIIGIISVKRE